MGRSGRTTDVPASERAWDDLEEAGLRALSGRRLGFWQQRAGLVVLGSDVDHDSGVAAVWLVQHAGSPDSAQHMMQFERVGGWRCLGAASSSARELSLASRRSALVAGPVAMMTPLSGCSGRSRADRDALGDQLDYTRVGWVACAGFRVAAEVAHVQVGARRIKVPEHGYVIVAWKAPPSSGSPIRPPIVALGQDGSRLTELAPGQHVDSLTWAAVEAAIAGD